MATWVYKTVHYTAQVQVPHLVGALHKQCEGLRLPQDVACSHQQQGVAKS